VSDPSLASEWVQRHVEVESSKQLSRPQRSFGGHVSAFGQLVWRATAFEVVPTLWRRPGRWQTRPPSCPKGACSRSLGRSVHAGCSCLEWLLWFWETFRISRGPSIASGMLYTSVRHARNWKASSAMTCSDDRPHATQHPLSRGELLLTRAGPRILSASTDCRALQGCGPTCPSNETVHGRNSSPESCGVVRSMYPP
jgi:hypothetical protein